MSRLKDKIIWTTSQKIIQNKQIWNKIKFLKFQFSFDKNVRKNKLWLYKHNFLKKN